MGKRTFSTDEFSRVESIVSRAGQYVRPTDDLRARTLEAAREQHAIRRGQRRVRTLTLAVVLATTISVSDGPLRPRASSETDRGARELHSLHEQAIQRSVGSRVDLGWALYEVYSELRRAQALQLGRATPDQQTVTSVDQLGPLPHR